MAAGGSVAVVAAMGAHRDDGAVQSNGCDALAELAKAEDSRAPIVAAGGIVAVVAAMGAHLEDGDIQCHGCDAQGPHLPAFSCSGCPSTHGDTQLRVYREPKGHTVAPSTDPASTFAELAAWVLRVAG